MKRLAVLAALLAAGPVCATYPTGFPDAKPAKALPAGVRVSAPTVPIQSGFS